MAGKGNICSVYDCHNYSVQKNSLSQFRFPRDKEICAQWVAKCGSSKLEEVFKKRGSLYTYKVCSKHFAVTDFRNPLLTSQGLKKGVVPSLHMWPLGSVSNPSQENVLSTEKRSHKEKTALASSSSKDKLNDAQSLKPTKTSASAKKIHLAIYPVTSAAADTRTTKNVSIGKHSMLFCRRQNTAKDNIPKVVRPIILYKSKTSSIRRTELPVNLTCAALHCTSQSNSMPGLQFHHFPTNKIRAIRWAINCDRPDLIDLDQLKLHKDYVLCSLHFESHDYTNRLTSCLNQFAIPTLFDKSNHNISETSSSSSFAYSGMSTSVMKTEPSEANPISEIQTSQGSFDENSPEYKTDGHRNENSQETFHAEKNPLCSTTTRPSLKHIATQTDLPWKNNTTVIADNSTTSVLCRLCASTMLRSQMVHIFKQSSDSKQYIHIINQLFPSSEQVTENDNMPQWICNDCCGILDYCDQAVQGFLAANKKLKHLLCNLVGAHGTKTNKAVKAAIKNTIPCSEMVSVKEEVTVDDCQTIKEEIIDEEQSDEDQDDATNEQLEHDICTSQQVEDDSSDDDDDDDAESVCLKVAKRKRENANVQICYDLKSGSSDKVIRRDGQNHVHDTECFKNTNTLCVTTNKLTGSLLKHTQETIIQSSHTTILTSKDKNTYLCQMCDMVFDSIEAALTHRFKKHSHEEFSNQVKM